MGRKGLPTATRPSVLKHRVDFGIIGIKGYRWGGKVPPPVRGNTVCRGTPFGFIRPAQADGRRRMVRHYWGDPGMASAKRTAIYVVLGAWVPMSSDTPALAGSHLWRFNEIFSNADGTVQFIEMRECCGSTFEWGLSGKWVLAVDTDNQFTFPSDLSGDTANRHLLLATQAFADLSGVPAPDFIIPDNFLPLGGDTLEYWMYPDATWSYGPGTMPVDGVDSLEVGGTIGPNSPTNYAGDSGSVNLNTVPAVSDWGMVVMILFMLAAGTVVLARSRRAELRSR